MSVVRVEQHRVEVTPQQAAAQPYMTVPFVVSDEDAVLTVTYAVEGEGARIDIGVVDERGAGPGLPGFRGWSGSARSTFTIAPEDATPGYLPGPLTPGRWHVLIGLYQVPEPCVIDVTVDLSNVPGTAHLDEGPATLAEAREEQPHEVTRVILGMVGGDLHTHTVHSGDAVTPIPVSTLVAAAERRRLGFLAVTDHNTVAHHRRLESLATETPVGLIGGQEVTTYRGHFNAWGITETIDFRITDDTGLARALAAVTDQDGVASICHPKTAGPAWELPTPDGFAAVEAWGAPWVWGNGESLRFWDGLLRQGRRLTAVGGSDIHDLRARPGHSLATPTTWVPVEDDPLVAVVEGRVVVSESPRGPVVVPMSPGGEPLLGGAVGAKAQVSVAVHGGEGGRLRTVAPGGPVGEVDIDDPEQVVDVGRMDHDWLRFELWGPGSVRSGPVAGRLGALRALTNPVYNKRATRGAGHPRRG